MRVSIPPSTDARGSITNVSGRAGSCAGVGSPHYDSSATRHNGLPSNHITLGQWNGHLQMVTHTVHTSLYNAAIYNAATQPSERDHIVKTS